MPTEKGSFHLFRFAGIDVFLHWSWFLVVAYAIQYRRGNYSNIVWNVWEVIGLFAIVLMHEFGHSLACRQVGGRAEKIVLWPFGGVAYVDPPQRPGATLWSIAAGPLVNVILAPVLFGLVIFAKALNWPETLPNLAQLVKMLFIIDIGLLIFNVLPVYPMDGGQILRSVLWFFLGRSKSLTVATVIGFFGIAAFIMLAVWERSVWLFLITVFLGMNCWRGFQYSRALNQISKISRRAGFVCPACKAAPPSGTYWPCDVCKAPFDMFASMGHCPHCLAIYDIARCPDCGKLHPINDWISPAEPAKL